MQEPGDLGHSSGPVTLFTVLAESLTLLFSELKEGPNSAAQAVDATYNLLTQTRSNLPLTAQLLGAPSICHAFPMTAVQCRH